MVSPPNGRDEHVIIKLTEIGHDQVLHVPQLQEVDQTMLAFDIDIIVKLLYSLLIVL